MGANEIHKITGSLVQLGFLVGGYVLAASSEIWLINALVYDYDCTAPILCTILLNAYWPLQSVIYYYVRQTTEGPARESPPWLAYMFMGTSAGAVSLMRSVGINELSGMAYVVCSNTEILFCSFFSVTLLGKSMNSWHISAVALVMGAVGLAVYGEGGSGGQFGDGFVSGAVFTVLSRMLSAFNSVLAEWCLGKNKKAAWVVHELPIAQAVMPTLFLPLLVIAVPSAKNEPTKQWVKLFGSEGPTEMWGTGGKFLLYTIIGSMAVSKLVDRLCKMGIIGTRNTIFFEGVDAAMKSIAGIGSFLIFRKEEGGSTNWTDFVALGIIMIALGLITHGDEVEKEYKKALQDGNQYKVLNEESPDILTEDRRSGRSIVSRDGKMGLRISVNDPTRERMLTSWGRSLQLSLNLAPVPDGFDADCETPAGRHTTTTATGSVLNARRKTEDEHLDLASERHTMAY